MSPKYFKEQIEEELHGAKCYIKKAMEVKASHPSWSTTFESMSKAELGHATNLYKMLMNYDSSEYSDSYVSSVKNYVTELYTHCTDELDKLYDAYGLIKNETTTASKPSTSSITTTI